MRIIRLIQLDRPHDGRASLLAQQLASSLIPTKVPLRVTIIMDGEAHPEHALIIVEPIAPHFLILPSHCRVRGFTCLVEVFPGGIGSQGDRNENRAE